MSHGVEEEAAEAPGCPRTSLYNSDQAFSVPWLNSCLEETLLPGRPWHEVLKRLEAALADDLEHQLRHLKQREIIFHLLGQGFVKRHFSNCPSQPSPLYFTDMSEINSTELEEDAKVWLQNRCSKAAECIHCQFSFDSSAVSLAPEMVRFLDDTYDLVRAEMEFLLATCEARQKEKGGQESETWYKAPHQALSRNPKQASPVLKRSKSIESKDVSLVLCKSPPSQPTGNEKDLQLRIRPELHPPVLSCPESDVLGDLLCAIISQGPECMSAACERLRGQLLPKTLRRFIWADKLLRSGSKRLKTERLTPIEREARETFGQTIAQRIAELKLRSASRSPVSGLIENAVVEKYGKVPCMLRFATNEEVILESSKTLNVLYVFDGTYEPYLIFWLFPLQMAFKQITPRAEHPYELAMYLHSLCQNLFPNWTKIFVMAESVMHLLEREDVQLFAHLQRAFQKNITIEPKDFLVELIFRERGSAQENFAFENGSQRQPSLTKEYLTGPVVFLRKWMGEGFVGVLELPAVLLIWDQLFMQDWSPNVMQSFCASILLLLKDSFMAADDYPATREVFLRHASRLLTADIQRAWIHLQQRGLPADIPGLNRLTQRSLAGLSPGRDSAEAGKTYLGFREISPTGVKDILLKIVLPIPQTDTPHAEILLQNFDPSALKLTVSVFCGPEKMRSRTLSLKPPPLWKTREKTAHWCETAFTYNFNESFVFDALDPTAFVDATDSKPYLLLRVLCSPRDKDPVTVGWQKVDAFQAETAASGMIWAPREFSTCVPLNPGEVPESIMQHPSRLLPQELAEGHSTVQLTVYDVAKEKLRLSRSRVTRERLQEPSFLHAPWVPHNPSVVLPKPPRISQPFDLYIDALRYIPDNATITKVTGQLRSSGLRSLSHFVAFPVLESSCRNPEFQYRAEIRGSVSEELDSNSWILLHVHTIDADSGDLVLLGSCTIRVFNAEGQVNVGGFQLKLRAGLPEDVSAAFTPSSLNLHPAIPCCTLLIRLLPHSQIPVPTPNYLTGYYFTDGAKPSNPELNIISSFQKDDGYPRLVRDMAVELTHKEESRVLPDQLDAWCADKLDERRHLLPQRFPKSINIHCMVRYRQETGVRIRIKQAFGLKDGYYVNVLARIFKGAASLPLPELPQHWGGEEKFLTQQLDFFSLQSSPRWTDPSVTLHPYLDDHTVLLVQIYGLDAVYTPDPSGEKPGEVMPRPGRVLELNAQSQLGWSALPLFDRSCVRTGIHSTPLFQGMPSSEFLQDVISRPVKDVMAEGLQKKRLKLLATYGSVAVEVWDAHYCDDDHHELPVLNDLLTIEKTRKLLAAQASQRGKDMSQLVLKSLDKKSRKLGHSSVEYERQERFYKQAMENAFYTIVETALLNAGYGPL